MRIVALAALICVVVALAIWIQPVLAFVFLAAYVVVPIAAAVFVAHLFRPDGQLRSPLAAGLGFAIMIALSAALYAANGPEDLTKDSDCDGFCTTLTGGWVLMFYFAAIFGAFVAVAAAIFAAFVPRRNSIVP